VDLAYSAYDFIFQINIINVVIILLYTLNHLLVFLIIYGQNLIFVF